MTNLVIILWLSLKSPDFEQITAIRSQQAIFTSSGTPRNRPKISLTNAKNFGRFSKWPIAAISFANRNTARITLLLDSLQKSELLLKISAEMSKIFARSSEWTEIFSAKLGLFSNLMKSGLFWFFSMYPAEKNSTYKVIILLLVIDTILEML